MADQQNRPPVERDAKGRITKGTPNPGGRPKRIKEILAEFGDPDKLRQLRDRLMELAHDGDGRVAVAAIKEWHDRAYGKPSQALTGEDGQPLKFGVVMLPAAEVDGD